jgi:cell division protein FtsB
MVRRHRGPEVLMDTPESRIEIARWPGRRTVRYLLIVLGCVVLADALVGEKGFLAMIRAREHYRALERSLAAARTENARLVEEARRLREDPAAIEDVARRDLGLIRPGEKLFIIRDTVAGAPR